jgi:LacI family transcriptional regulator
MNKQVSTMRGAGNGARHDGENDFPHGHAHGVRPTMKDVASRAGVALKTVSRVVNGEPGVTQETTERVLGAIQNLGFRRNESARLLRTGRTATLGFIADSWADPDFAAVYRGLEDVVGAHGYLLYAGSTDSDAAREERLTLAMCARRVDGLIVTPAMGSHEYLVPEIEAGVATVFVMRSPATAGGDTVLTADAVLPDERAGGRAAVAHLIAQGHRRIGFLGDGHRSRQLLAGYAEAMRAAGLTADAAGLGLDASELDKDRVTAVLCADRPRTEAVLRVLGNSAGPGRMAVIGFGDFELADLVSPGLTVVSYDPTLIGRTAGELLVRRLAGDRTPPRTVEVPIRLLARGSAEFPPDGN